MTPDSASVRVLDAALGSTLLDHCLDVRRAVFVQEQGVPADLELDARDDDPATHHLAAVLADHATHDPNDIAHVIGTVRWIAEPAEFEGLDPDLGAIAHLQRLAVSKAARGTGTGALLVAAVETQTRQAGHQVLYLAAQITAVPFYERLAYAAFGAPFMEAGIEHRHMTKQL